MIGKKRNEIEILREILELCKKQNIRKTRIVYRCNLNFSIVKKYLEFLLKEKLLNLSKGIYATTDKGLKTLDNISMTDEQFNYTPIINY